jgi:protease-4
MPATKVYAEPTTITGSIGVYAALPNVSELAANNGVKVELIKAGDIKASGSMFHPLGPEERQPWQDMVDHAYDRFLSVVAAGRPALTKERLVAEKTTRQVPRYDDQGRPVTGQDGKPVTITQTRYRADGGTYTPQQARDLGLIDEIGDLAAAVRVAAETAQLSDYRAVRYERPKGLAELLLGVRQPTPGTITDTTATLSVPRLWYLTPGYEFAGSLATAPHP